VIPQQHKIMRQVLEARGCPEGAAQRVRAELRDTYYRRLLPLIEKACSELSAPGEIHRIDSLEIDLGTVPLDELDAALAGKFETAFSRSLAAAIGEAPKIDAELELFGSFARTGSVPWWADLSERGLLEANLDGLIKRAPQALRRTLAAAPDPERMLSRIARAYPGRLLDALAGVLAPSLSGTCPSPGAAWTTLLESVGSARGHAARAARNLWWEEVLRAASAGGAAVSGAAPFYRTVLTRVARRFGIGYRALVTDLHDALGESALPPVQPWMRDIIKDLWQELERDAATRRESVQSIEPSQRDLTHLLAQLASATAALEVDRARAAFDADRASGRESLSLATVNALGALLRSALDHGLAAPEARECYAALMRQGAPAGTFPAIPSELGAALLDTIRKALERKAALTRQATPPAASSAGKAASAESAEKAASAESRFSDADELYVGNAGLVILWPFLGRFFALQELLEENKFKTPAALQRAAGLLQYLATGENAGEDARGAALPEYLLPLNKVLCGMPLEEVFDFGPPITDAEIEACDDLLGAVIQQAPVLREMSIAGFRASFLLRKGQLSARDGNWLLRVERETHDVVLDRFPWSANLVKLPWMEAMMQVEW
jgi:Contractile injection system tape measure protein